jgi:hypothetical protein
MDVVRIYPALDLIPENPAGGGWNGMDYSFE